MPACCIKGCTNHDRKVNKENGNVTFHRFPIHPVRNEAWCRIVRQQRNEPCFKSNKYLRICSEHFKSEDFCETKAGRRKLMNAAIPCNKLQALEADEIYSSTATNADVINSKNKDFADLDMSDMQSIFDTPRKVELKRKLKRSIVRNFVKSKKIKNLQKQNNRLQKKNESLIDAIKELKEKRLITSEIEEALGVTPELAELYSLQIKYNKRKCPKKKKKQSYPPALRKFAMSLNFYSPAAYKYIRKKFNYCLPHPRTLTKWYSSIDGEPGFTKEAFDRLNLKRGSMTENIEGALMFDEMNIRQAKLWKGGRNVGHVDMGNGNTNKERTATKALVLMLVCLKENWKIPLGYFLVDNMSSEQLASSLSICLEKLHHVGVNTNALVCDGCPSNIRALNILGTNISNVGDLKTTFPHPTTNADVTVFLDACHMIKLVRNTFEKKKVLFNAQGQSIQWKYLTRLLKLQTNNKLHFGNKLTTRHIHFKNQIMKVRLAVQLLSKSVANAIKLCDQELKNPYFANSAATVEFIEIFNNMFDILNSRRFNQFGFKKAICKENEKEVFDFIDKAIEYIKSLKLYSKVKRTIKKTKRQPRIILNINKKPVVKSQSKTGFLGLIVCLESLKILYRKLVDTKKMSYISTYRLSQDHLELFFGILRRNGGYNDNPNCIQYKGAYRRALNHLSLKSSFTGNSIPLDNFPILTVSSITAINATTSGFCYGEDSETMDIEEMETENDDIYSNNCDIFSQALDENLTAYIDVEVEVIVGYIAGWIARVLCRKLKCEPCVSSLLSNERLSFHKMIEIKSMGSLCFPSEDLFKVCLETEKNLRRLKLEHMDKRDFSRFVLKCLQNFKGKDTFTILDCHSMEQPATLNHRLHLIRSIIEKYTNVRKHYESKIKNTSKITKRQKFKKLVLFEGQ